MPARTAARTSQTPAWRHAVEIDRARNRARVVDVEKSCAGASEASVSQRALPGDEADVRHVDGRLDDQRGRADEIAGIVDAQHARSDAAFDIEGREPAAVEDEAVKRIGAVIADDEAGIVDTGCVPLATIHACK